VLVGGAGLGLVLSFAGAWFLAGRALVPIQQAFQRQQEFVADASHELRTPLTVLQSSADVLDRHRHEPLATNAEVFDDVRSEIDRMVRLTTDLLTLARTDSGDLELLVAPVNMSDLAGEVVRRTLPLARARAVELESSLDGPPPTVEADPDRLQQVLLILLDNAIKHTPAGGRVNVLTRQRGGYGVLEVADTGEGIAPQHLSRIFDRFYRADKARSRAEGGTGLGLAIAKMLIDAHHGEISVSSAPGLGTRITVRLPLEGQAPSLGRRLEELTARLAH
jgi:two-component system sensor histidine kinase CiaH